MKYQSTWTHNGTNSSSTLFNILMRSSPALSPHKLRERLPSKSVSLSSLLYNLDSIARMTYSAASSSPRSAYLILFTIHLLTPEWLNSRSGIGRPRSSLIESRIEGLRAHGDLQYSVFVLLLFLLQLSSLSASFLIIFFTLFIVFDNLEWRGLSNGKQGPNFLNEMQWTLGATLKISWDKN